MFSFDVYCAVLPSEWWVDSLDFNQSAAVIGATYRTSTGIVQLEEGAYCTKSAASCAERLSTLGETPFGDLTGELVLTNSTPSYAVRRSGHNACLHGLREWDDPGAVHGHCLGAAQGAQVLTASDSAR